MSTDTHSPTPPCDCDSCRRATLAADVRRAETAKALSRADYVPPTDRALELEALLQTAAITTRAGIADPNEVRAIHASILRMAIASKEQQANQGGAA